MTKEDIGAILKQLRLTCNMTQKEVAEKIGRKQQIVGHWETGYAQPDANTLFTLCEIYGTTVDEAFGFSRKEHNITSLEYDHIKKYRFVSHYDETGRTILDSLLDCLYDKIKQSQEKDARIKELEITTLPTRFISYYQKLASAGSGEYLFDEIPCDNIVVPENSLSEKADFVLGVNGHSMEPTYHDGDKVYVEISEEIPTGSIGIFTKGNECFIKELGHDRLISHNPDKNTYPDISASEDIRCVGLVLGKVENI